MDSTAPITLDYTLRDLYSLDNDAGSKITLIYNPSHLRSRGTSSSAKFSYQYMLHTGPVKDPGNLLYNRIVPQRFGFSAGKMPVILLDSDFSSDDQSLGRVPAHHVDACVNFAQIQSDQQPILSFANGPEDILQKEGDQIAALFPTDCLSHLSHVIDPDIHFELLSKRGLALSGLPTPPTEIIDTVLKPSHIYNEILLKNEIARMIKPIDEHKRPFFVKLPQSVSGKGTFNVCTEADRESVKTMLTIQLSEMLQQINSSNHHMYPCSLVLQDCIQGEVVALSLFVTKKGRPIFIACCRQRFNEQGHWIGGSISYEEQSIQEKAYSVVAKKVASFLHQKGYYGPVGVDVITDQYGKQHIIDLNVRVTGTYHFGPLTGHFTQRGLFEATTIIANFPCPRASFEETFAEKFRRGSLIIHGWTYDESMRLSHAAVIVGGRNSSELERSLMEIEAYVAPN